MATWSPGSTPRAARKCASRLLSRSRSAYVATRSPTFRAGLSGTASTACSKRSAMFSATAARLEHVLVFDYDRPVTSTDVPGVATAPHCLVEQDGHKLVVTMNRPEARNALSGEMLAIMSE